MALILILGGIVTIYLIIIFFSKAKKSSNHISKLPPGNTGWPIVGESLDFISSPAKFVRNRMIKHSPDIFQTSIVGEKMVVLCGASGNKFIFSNEVKFRFWLPKSILTGFSLESIDKGTPFMKFYLEQLHNFFRLETMLDYVPFMDIKTRDHMEKHWIPYNEVKVQSLTKEFGFSLACHLLISRKADPARELGELFIILAERLLSVPINLPGTSYNRALKASRIVRDKLVDMIRRRKAELLSKADHVDVDIDIHGQDLLSRILIASGNEYDGDSIYKEFAGLLIGLLFAGFHTTSTATSFSLGYLAEYPHVYEKVLKEQLEIAQSKTKQEMLTWKDVQRMKYTWNVVCESMRLKPPAVGSFREAVDDISYAGFTIPKGSKVFWNVYSTHMDPTYFPNPEKFEPLRFEEKLPPHVFVPFGGGPLMCCGREYARIETLVYLHHVVTRFRLSKANPQEKIIFRPHPFSVEGLRIQLHPHET